MDSDQAFIVQNTFTPNLKTKVKEMYASINSQLNSNGFEKYSCFLNYGYVGDESIQYSSIELAKNLISKNSVKLILEVVGDCNIQDSKILDIGCGRGGNASSINQYFAVKSIVGIDLSSRVIAFCKQHFENDKINFIEGDAENLPFENSSFDVVTNIESSHCYPNIFDFYTEVHRVLRIGGYFLYTDIFSKEFIDYSLNFLKSIGFVLEIERDITNNVILS